jgi:hypothetical protein
MNCESCKDLGYFNIEIYNDINIKLECECNFKGTNKKVNICRNCNGSGKVLCEPYLYYCNNCEGKGLLV